MHEVSFARARKQLYAVIDAAALEAQQAIRRHAQSVRRWLGQITKEKK